MPKLLRWAIVALSGLLVVLVAAAAVLYLRGGARLDRTYDIAVSAPPVPSDDASIARGRHLAEAVALCTGCHGDDLGGGVLVDEPMIATIHASNLTRGRGGIGASYTDADYVRAIRHGVNPAGRGLLIMHADAYHRLGESDLGAVIAYVKSVPPVDKEHPRTRGAALGRIMVALGLFDSPAMPLIPAEVIDHGAPIPRAPPPGVTVEYGGYLVAIALCAMCHGSDLKGGPPVDEGAPPGPDLTAYALPGGFTDAQFVATLRTGTTPSGRALNAEFMPWKVYARMTDDELLAIRRYLLSRGSR